MNDQLSNMKSITRSFTARFFLIGFLMVILFVTLIPVQILTEERSWRYENAKQEVSSKWGNAQTIVGPILTVPYYDPNIQNGIKENLRVLPEDAVIKSKIIPEIRSRGIFDVPLYTTEVTITGTFPAVDSLETNYLENKLRLDQASLNLGVSDLKGMIGEVKFLSNGKKMSVKPASGLQYAYVPSSLVAYPAAIAKNERLKYEIRFSLRGSTELNFAPVAKKTKASMESSWPSPSFIGAYLPTSRTITDDGFTAEWDIAPYVKNYPDHWLENSSANIDSKGGAFQETFGTQFLFPADFYQKTVRSVKYGILFIAFTFLTFFIFEVKFKTRVHPFQYLLVGLSLTVFYLLLLSLAEHIGFAGAYLIASAATIALITSYTMKVLERSKHGAIMGIVLAALYGYLYFLLSESDYALLIGSISLFLAIGAAMFLTRNIKWYELEGS